MFCKSFQQEYQEDYAKDGSHVQGLACNASLCSTCILHHNKNIYRSYTLFPSLQDENNNVVRSINPIFKGTYVIKTWGKLISSIWDTNS